jgi:hypothetical protein
MAFLFLYFFLSHDSNEPLDFVTMQYDGEPYPAYFLFRGYYCTTLILTHKMFSIRNTTLILHYAYIHYMQ